VRLNRHPEKISDAVVARAVNGGSRAIELRPFSEIRRESVDWLLPGRVPLGMLTLLIGDGGLGKSLFTCMLAAQLSRGELLSGTSTASVLLTAEDSRSVTMRPRLEAAGARLELVHSYDLRTPAGVDEGGLVIPDDLALLDQAIGDARAKLVTIDPLGAHLPGTINPWQDQSVRQALAPLGRLAERHGCAVLAILHLNKRESTDALRRINGSTAFGAAARSVLLFARDPDDPDEAAGHRRVLSHVKCNVAPLATGQLYEVDPMLLPQRGDEPEALTARLSLIGETSRNGADLLGRDVDHERSALEEAEDFLREELAMGPRPAKDVRVAAAQIGIAAKTLERARHSVCLKPKKLGFSGGWEWALKQPSLFAYEERQTPRLPSSPAEVDDLGTSTHGYADSDPSEGPKNAEERHNGDMAIFELPEPEQAVLAALAEELDAREIERRERRA